MAYKITLDRKGMVDRWAAHVWCSGLTCHKRLDVHGDAWVPDEQKAAREAVKANGWQFMAGHGWFCPDCFARMSRGLRKVAARGRG
jgi:hypothetical protein